MTRLFLLSAYCLVLSASVVYASDDVGVLILAHGGSKRWNETVTQTVAQAQLPYPTEIVFGMGMHPHDVQHLHRALERLQRRGVSRIVAVPLLVSSASEVMRQYEYLLGLRDHGPWETHVRAIAPRVPIIMKQPLDDDPVVAEVLVERAKELSQNPRQETVILVAHGPNADDDNQKWLDAMQHLAARVQLMGGFRAVIPVTMRDDAPKSVRETAIRHLRELVRQHSQEGRALVVPLLLANGGIEAKISQCLRGLRYAYRGDALLPHPKLAQWVATQVYSASPLVAKVR